MATILTKQVKDVYLLHSSGHTPARLKAFSSLFVKKIGRVSAYFENWQIGTQAHQARVPIWVK